MQVVIIQIKLITLEHSFVLKFKKKIQKVIFGCRESNPISTFNRLGNGDVP